MKRFLVLSLLLSSCSLNPRIIQLEKRVEVATFLGVAFLLPFPLEKGDSFAFSYKEFFGKFSRGSLWNTELVIHISLKNFNPFFELNNPRVKRAGGEKQGENEKSFHLSKNPFFFLLYQEPKELRELDVTVPLLEPLDPLLFRVSYSNI